MKEAIELILQDIDDDGPADDAEFIGAHRVAVHRGEDIDRTCWRRSFAKHGLLSPSSYDFRADQRVSRI